MDEEGPKVVVFVGRTAGGFIKFLKENKLNTIEPEILADYVRQSIINFEKDDRAASNRLLNDIWDIVGAKDADMATEVARQFGKLCDMYRSLFQCLTGEVNLSEELEKNV